MPSLQVFIDYPGENERIDSNLYTFRVGTTPQVHKVEVSIDGGPWMACRAASGYWWYDWICFETGDHRVAARASMADGAVAASKPRRFKRGAA